MQCFRPSLSYHLSFRLGFLSIFEWPLKTGFTVTKKPILPAHTYLRSCRYTPEVWPMFSFLPEYEYVWTSWSWWSIWVW